MLRFVLGAGLFVPILVALIAACSPAAGSADPHAHHSAAAAPEAQGTVQRALVVLSDAPMLDQTGAVRRLKSDIAEGRIIVVDFIFTSCQTICPVTTALMADGHRRLSDISGDDLAFISMSVDARTDTPARLAAFAARHGAEWSFLTGEKPVMDEALTWLNAYAIVPEDHTAMIVIGDTATGEFSRIYGLPDPAVIEGRVRALMARRQAAPAVLHQH
ncbi:SCO family protein [Hyphomonas sp.]|uniref:SCO family protein n=1 Tax=Hyphomonas sp. TaxID=87 RepID=UPI00391C532B